MDIKFKINELGPIRDSEITFKPFMLLSGDSNTGKSYTAILMYQFMKMFSSGFAIDLGFGSLISKKYDILEKLKNNGSFNEKIDLKYIAEEFSKNCNSYLHYFLGEKITKCDIELIFSESMHMQLEIGMIPDFNAGSIISYISDNDENSNNFQFNIPESIISNSNACNILINLFLKTFLSKILFNSSIKNALILPPARGGLIGATYSTKSKTGDIGLYSDFFEQNDQVLFGNKPEIYNRKSMKAIKKLFTNIIDGEIKIKDKKHYYKFQNGEVEINATASSIKELAPLYDILDNLESNALSLFIEEPEAHLHPALQRKVARLLAYVINEGGFIQATTHSDFFFNQINNLIKLHHIKNKVTKTKFKRILKELGILEQSVLDPDMIGAYYYEKQIDGSLKIKEIEKSENGLALDTFAKTYEDSMEETYYLRELLSDE